jgi:hypothetical protein
VRFALVRHRARVLEAMVLLTGVGLMLRILPFHIALKLMGVGKPRRGEDLNLRRTRDPVAAAVGVAVNRAAARLPWHFTCLVRALAGRLMLVYRGVPSTVVVGVTKTMEQIHAHAWLVARNGTVCGGREAAGFQPIAAFQELDSRDV